MVTSCHNSHLGMLALQICNPLVSLVLGAPLHDAHMQRCPVHPAHVAHWVSFLARKLVVHCFMVGHAQARSRSNKYVNPWAIPAIDLLTH